MTRPQPFVIDTNVFDKIADEPDAAALVQRLVADGVLELLVTHIQMDQMADIPDERRRTQLLEAVPCRVVPTHGAVWDVSKWDMARYTSEAVEGDLSEIERRNRAQDALIGVTAKWDRATLVTEDRKFRSDASAAGVAVLSWPQFIAHLRAMAL